jgi:hypothetical protein
MKKILTILLLSLGLSTLTQGCKKEQIFPKSSIGGIQALGLQQTPESCWQRQERIIKQTSDSIRISHEWRLSMDYYDYIVYRDSMRNIYNGQRERNELTEEQWNHLMAELDMSWWKYQEEARIKMREAIEDELRRLRDLGILYDCPPQPTNVQNY